MIALKDIPSLQFKWSSQDALLSHVVSNVDSVIQCSEARMHYQHMLLPSLKSFITSMYSRCRLTPTVLIVALIYLDRLKRNLPNQARGEYDTNYKLFLAAILLASKYIEDHNRSIKSIYRAVAPLYCPRELVEMERSFLAIVNFDLYVDLDQVYRYTQERKTAVELELAANETISLCK